MRCIAYTRPDGGVSVVHLARDGRLWQHPRRPPVEEGFRSRRGITPEQMTGAGYVFETEAEQLTRARARDVPADARDVVELDEAELPDRRFREAWRVQGGKVVVAAPE